jgi:hypothetical protein
MNQTCTTCGSPLDAMGICPNASSADVARSTCPVYCDATRKHGELCDCLTCTILAQLDASKETAPCILF